MRNLAMIVEFWTGRQKPSSDGVRLIAARSIVASKVALRGAFPAGLVNDPVVEIMMAAYIAGATAAPFRVRDACAATGNTPAVAQRWVAALRHDGLLQAGAGAGGDEIVLTGKGLGCAIAAIDGMLEAQATVLG